MVVVRIVGSQPEAVESIEAPPQGREPWVTVAQVPFAQHVGCVAETLKFLWQDHEGLVHPELFVPAHCVVLHAERVRVPCSDDR